MLAQGWYHQGINTERPRSMSPMNPGSHARYGSQQVPARSKPLGLPEPHVPIERAAVQAMSNLWPNKWKFTLAIFLLLIEQPFHQIDSHLTFDFASTRVCGHGCELGHATKSSRRSICTFLLSMFHAKTGTPSL